MSRHLAPRPHHVDQSPHLSIVLNTSVSVSNLASNPNVSAGATSAEPVRRPPLDSIIQGWNVTGDPSWLLNFAVVGFPKCGTSTLMHHLRGHPQVQIFSQERCDLSGNQQVPLIRDLYNELPAGNYVRGFKCPASLESTNMALINYQRFFPKTKFIVGIRHPM